MQCHLHSAVQRYQHRCQNSIVMYSLYANKTNIFCKNPEQINWHFHQSTGELLQQQQWPFVWDYIHPLTPILIIRSDQLPPSTCTTIHSILSGALSFKGNFTQVVINIRIANGIRFNTICLFPFVVEQKLISINTMPLYIVTITEVSVNSLGNPCSQSWRRKWMPRWEGFAEKEGLKHEMKEWVGDGVIGQTCSTSGTS